MWRTEIARQKSYLNYRPRFGLHAYELIWSTGPDLKVFWRTSKKVTRGAQRQHVSVEAEHFEPKQFGTQKKFEPNRFKPTLVRI